MHFEKLLTDSAAFMRFSAGALWLLFLGVVNLYEDSISKHKTTHFYYLQDRTPAQYCRVIFAERGRVSKLQTNATEQAAFQPDNVHVY